jgi:hypothetical protein
MRSRFSVVKRILQNVDNLETIAWTQVDTFCLLDPRYCARTCNRAVADAGFRFGMKIRWPEANRLFNPVKMKCRKVLP